MSSIARVILDSASLRDDKARTTAFSRFSLRDKTFYRIDNPDPEIILIARSAIQLGLSAAIITDQLLRPEAIFFDMDGTVIEEESLVEISKVAGKERQIAQLTEKAMTGQMDFSESLKMRLKILAGLSLEQVQSIKPTICPGMHDIAAWCRDHAIPMFLVSGGFMDLAEPIANALGFTGYRANKFCWDGNIMRGEVSGEIIDAEGKKNAILAWCHSLGISPRRTVAIGDGANDLQMLQTCGLAVGFRPKPILWPNLQIANHTGDHCFLLEALK